VERNGSGWFVAPEIRKKPFTKRECEKPQETHLVEFGRLAQRFIDRKTAAFRSGRKLVSEQGYRLAIPRHQRKELRDDVLGNIRCLGRRCDEEQPWLQPGSLARKYIFNRSE